MSSLRKRFLGDSSVETSLEPSRVVPPEKDNSQPTIKVQKVKPRKRKRQYGFIFGLGGLFGLLAAAFLASNNDAIHFEGLLDLNLDTLLDVVPSSVIKDAREITVRSSLFAFYGIGEG